MFSSQTGHINAGMQRNSCHSERSEESPTIINNHFLWVAATSVACGWFHKMSLRGLPFRPKQSHHFCIFHLDF